MTDTPIALAVLDMAGTTVADDGLVFAAFDAACAAADIPAQGPDHDRAVQYVIDTMGQSKIVVFRALLDDDEDRAQAANAAFERTYDDLIDTGRAVPVDGAEIAIEKLRSAGVKVALTTGFSTDTQQRLVDFLGWQHLTDLVLAPSPGVRGRPHPDLVLTALMRLDVDDVRHVAVLGDTANDILTGRRAGAAIVAGTLTGAHDADRLRAAGATDIVDTVGDFADLLLGRTV
ncbi:phosphonatase-like hydrolase [Williamsia sterculiae]|uniref:Phosphonatase-like hydrolase n=1 Tax=Williamsia sterculiae TaxID=1344003 RepID=A0A1N7DGH6_9NOCA|nr:phosphonatase-like hydrolase [Williamsia sterculiae]SIR74963.1 phosphonatase-like hydrolase [Williamsia sterculiae]